MPDVFLTWSFLVWTPALAKMPYRRGWLQMILEKNNNALRREGGGSASQVLSRSRTLMPRPLPLVERRSLFSIRRAAVASWSRSR